MNASNLSLFAALAATGLIAGLFYAFSVSVNPGLAQLNDRAYVSAMQAINRAILNPVFYASFFGALVLLPLSAWLNYHGVFTVRVKLILWAFVVYLVAVFGVTAFANVPLNEDLANVDISWSDAQITQARLAFEKPWNNYHRARTIASFVTFLLAGAACFFSDKVKEEI